MSSLLGCLVFIVLGVFFLLIALVGNIVRVFQTLSRQAQGNHSRQRESHRHQSTSGSRPNSRTRRSHKGKIFEAGEGEYVDFEEIKN